MEPAPRPVTGGKGFPYIRQVWLRSGQAVPQRVLDLHYEEEVEQGEQVLTTNSEQVAPQQVQKVFKTREEARADARIEKASKLLEPGGMNTGPWNDTDIARVVTWVYEHRNDLSRWDFHTDALKTLAKELKRPEGATFRKVYAARNDEDEASSGDVMPQVPAANEMVDHSMYYDEQYTKADEDDVLDSMMKRIFPVLISPNDGFELQDVFTGSSSSSSSLSSSSSSSSSLSSSSSSSSSISSS